MERYKQMRFPSYHRQLWSSSGFKLCFACFTLASSCTFGQNFGSDNNASLPNQLQRNSGITIGNLAGQQIDQEQIDQEQVGPGQSGQTVIHETARAENQLAIKMLGKLFSKDNENCICSPYGAFECLTFARSGVSGEARQQIDSVTGITANHDLALGINSLRQRLLGGLQSSAIVLPDQNSLSASQPIASSNAVLIPSVTFRSRNLLVHDRDVMPTPDFEAKVFRTMQINSLPIDWLDAASRKQASAVVQNHIAEVTQAQPLSLNYNAPELPKHSMQLVNISYFDGKWLTPFETASTRDGEFRKSNGQITKVPFMHMNEKKIAYHKGEYGESVSLPYAGNLHSMVLVLPSPKLKSDPQRLIDEIGKSLLVPILNTPFKTETVDLALPRFCMSSDKLDLKEICSSLGIKGLFSAGNELEKNFSAKGSTLNPLYVSNFDQDARISVDESGTIAAAVTRMDIVPLAAPINQTIRFEANRPFYFFVVDDLGTILFAGRVAEPK